MKTETWQSIPHAEIELIGEDNDFKGIGRIMIEGTDVRNHEWPLAPVIQTTGGWFFPRFELLGVENDGNVLSIKTRLTGEMSPLSPRGDWYHCSPPLRGPTDPPTAVVEWILEPLEKKVGNKAFRGVAYHYRYQSEDAPIHRLCDWATFELGGTATGNLMIMRNCAPGFETELTADTEFTSAETSAQGDIRTFMPRFGGLQCFDFQWQPEATMVLGYEKPDAINGAVRKQAGCDFVEIADIHQFAVTKEIETVPHWVLVAAAETPEKMHQGRTTWMRCWQWFRKHYAEALDMPLIDPDMLVQIEANPNVHEPESGVRILNYTKDKIVPQVAQGGFDAVYIGPWWECARSREEPVYGGASGPAESVSVCTPWEYAFAEAWGGEELMREVCAEGDRHGVKVAPWLASHMANRIPTSPLIQEHPDWRTVNYNSMPFDGYYADLISGDMNSDFGEYYFNQIRHFTEATGVKAWFFDSYSNLTMMPVNYNSEQRAPQFDKVWEIQRYCAQHGVPWYIEADGPFGAPCLAIGSIETDGDEPVMPRFNGEQWYGLIDCNFRIGVQTGQPIPDEFVFRALAARGPLVPSIRFHDGDTVDVKSISPDRHAHWRQTYKKVRDRMGVPELLPNDSGILWYEDDDANVPAVAWTFQPVTLEFAKPVSVTDGANGQSIAATVRSVDLKPFAVCMITVT